MEADRDKGTLASGSKELDTISSSSVRKKQKEIDRTGELPETRAESEEIGSFLVEIKQEHEDLPETASIESVIAGMAVNKEEPEWNQAEMQQFAEDSFMHEESKPDPTLLVKLENTLTEGNEEQPMDIPKDILYKNLSTGLDGSDISPKELGVSVKPETSGTSSGIEESSDLVDYNIKHEQLDLKEDIELNHTIVSPGGSNQGKRKNDKRHKCHVCHYQTKKMNHLKMHLIKHQNPDEVSLKCTDCDFKTIYKSSLKVHQLQHKNREEINWWKCNQCDYQTLQKHTLKQHINTHHKNLEEIVHFKCDKCNFKTIYRSNLTSHVLRHKDPNEVDTFKCTQCEYKTVVKSDIKKHLVVHQDPKDVNVFRCDKCNFTTTYKHCLKTHLLQHANWEDIDLFKCDQCDYRTFQKRDLNRHMLRHKNVKQVDAVRVTQGKRKIIAKPDLKKQLPVDQDEKKDKLFACDQCDFKAIHKRGLTVHYLRHKGLMEDDTFRPLRCTKCEFKTIAMSELKRHLFVQHDQKEVEMS